MKTQLLERHFETEAFNQFLIAVSNSHLSHLSDFSDFPLGFPFTSQDGSDVTGSSSYACGASSRGELEVARRDEGFVSDFLHFSLHGELIRELGDVLARFQGWNKVVKFLDEEPITASNFLFVYAGGVTDLIKRSSEMALSASHVYGRGGYALN